MKPDVWMTRFEGPPPVTMPSYGLGSIPPALRGVGLVALALIGMPAYTGTAGVALHAQDLNLFRSLEEKEEFKGDLEQRMSALVAEANGLPFNDDQKAEFEGLKTAHAAIIERIDEQKYVLSTVAQFATNGKAEPADGAEAGAVETPAFGRPAGSNGASTARRLDAKRVPSNVFDLGAYRRMAPTDAQYSQAVVDGAKAIIDRAEFYHQRLASDSIKTDVTKLFGTSEDPVALSEHIIKTSSPAYQRAFAEYLAVGRDGLSSEGLRALELGSDPAGGFMVPVQLDPTLIATSDGAINSLRGIARTERITGKEWQGVTASGIVVRRGAEKSKAVPSEPTLAQPTLRTVRVDTFIPFSIELGLAVGSVLAQVQPLIQDAKDEEEAESFVYGDGTGTEPGGLLGTMPNSSRLAVTDFSTADLYRLDGNDPNTLAARWRARAKFLAAKGIYNEVRQFADGSDGADLWVRLADGLPPGLLGYPSPEQSTMPASSSEAGSDFMVLGDFGQFLIVDRIGMSVEVIQHLTQQQTAGTGYGVPIGMRGIFAHWHNNARILVPNAFRVLHKGAVGSGS